MGKFADPLAGSGGGGGGGGGVVTGSALPKSAESNKTDISSARGRHRSVDSLGSVSSVGSTGTAAGTSNDAPASGAGGGHSRYGSVGSVESLGSAGAAASASSSSGGGGGGSGGHNRHSSVGSVSSMGSVEAEPTTLEDILAQYHDMNVDFGTSAAAPVVRKNAGLLLPQSQSGKVLPRSRLPPREDPSHVDFTGVDLRRCWAHFLPTDDITFYDKPMRIAVVQNAALGPSDSYGADGTALIVQRGGEWLLQYKELTIFNARGSEVRTYLSSKRQSQKSRDIEDLGEKGRLVPFESGVDGAHLGDAAGGDIEQRLHYAKGKLPQTLERMAATLFHPVEWVGIVLAKPSLAKPRTVGPLLYGVGNFTNYKRPRKLRREILDSVNAVKERFRELERKAHASRPNLTPESHHAVAKEIFLAFGKDAADRLEWPEFRVAMDRLGFHWSEHKLRPLFHLGDMDFQGWVSFQDLKYVLMVAAQLPRPGCISLWEYFAEFSQQNYGWVNDFEFWKIIHCSTTIKASIEDIEKCFEEFRNYSSPSKPEYILRYERFKLLWAQTVCKYGLCRTELARRGVGADLLKKHKVTPRGPWQFLLEVVERIDNWDSLCFERSKVQAYTHRRQARMEKASKLHKRTRRRVMGNVKSRVSKAREDKDEARKQMVKARDQEVRLQTEQRLKEQVALEVTNREVREREVLTQLVRRKVEWQEEQIVRKGKDTLDQSHRHLWRVPTELFKGQQAQSDLADIVLMKLNNNKISEVPGMDFLFWCSSLQQLDLSANRLVTLPRELGLLGNLRLLLLKDNRLCELPESLADLRELRVLTIAQNNIAKLPDEVGELRNLQRLDAAYNLLEDLPQNFGNCTTLENLDLDTNKLRDLPPSFSQLTRLKRLKLTCNHIRQLPADFGALRELEVLEVQTNQLERLPETIGQCAQLQIVMLQRNNIRMLPESFCQLSQLKELDLSRNNLLEVPAFFGGLGQLQVLDVSFNQCLELPASIGDIKYLRTFDCSNNRLSSLPPEIGALQLLEKFDASTNQIEGPMPLGLGTMYSLVRLNLSHNQITRLPANIGHLRHLDFMDISFNAFPSLPEALGNLVNLRYLNCSTNKLGSLPWNARNLANLEELNCSANSIQYLPREVGKMTKLRRLNVYNNKLRALPAELGGIIDNLEEFDAMRNPFTDFPEKWCANWTLSDQYTTLWSGYTNEEVKTWLKMLMHVYPVCVNVWEAHKQVWHTADARVLAFVQEVRKQCEAVSSWSNDLVPVVRGFYMYSKKHGVIPQYHQPYPGEPEELKAQREEWDRAKDVKVIRTRNSLDGFLEDQEKAYRFKQEKLDRIEARREEYLLEMQEEKRQYIAAQRAEADARVDRQVAVADAIEGERQMYRAQVTDVAMARLSHYNYCDSIREEKEELKALRHRRMEFRERVVQIERLLSVTQTSLDKIQAVIAQDEFLFEPQRVKQLHYKKRAEFVKQLEDLEKERDFKKAAMEEWTQEISRLEKQHDAYFDKVRENPPPGARMLTRFDV